MRLKTHVTASAILRQAQGTGLFATVVHKGDPDGGVLWVKVLAMNDEGGRDAALWAERYEGGFAARTDGFVPEAEANEVVARERDFDRDLWLIEVEGAAGADLVTG